MYARLALLVLASFSAAQAAPLSPCQASPEIRSRLQRASLIPVTDAMDFDRNIAPFRALRERYPANLFVHERYQDAVKQYGIEGHLRLLTEEYQQLALEHPGDAMYGYLSARAMMGRSTRAAIQGLNDILAEKPDFAPAHGSLAEIYASEAFRDEPREKSERERFQALCPGATLVQRPGPLPGPSGLIDQAEKLLEKHGNPDRAAAMAAQGIREDEWRLQRIRPFDWYSVSLKRQATEQVKAEYWKVWSIQVRCYRESGRSEKAGTLLSTMEQRARALADNAASDYWEAEAALAQLYIESNQKAQATQKLDMLSQSLSQHPDSSRATRLEDLRKLVEARVN